MKPVGAAGPVRQRGLFAERSGVYILIILAAMVAAWPLSFRAHSIFGCQASGYGTDRYLAYCNTTGYGDYDYGAFWFGLEREAIEAAANAQVLFLGNSRMQFGLSTEATDKWFASLPVSYYMLGFAYNGNYNFAAPLLNKLGPKATVYVINLDLFFEQTDTPPAGIVMRDAAAAPRYERKRWWQGIHQSMCTSHPTVCGDTAAFFRSRATGAWVVTGRGFGGAPVTYDEIVDERVLKAYAVSGREFLSNLPVRRECVILTMVPFVNTGIGTARGIAAALGGNLVAPEVEGLDTFDGYHLDRSSAQRWSAAFIEAAGPQIQKCLNETRVSGL